MAYGLFIAIDVETEAYEIGEAPEAATDKLLSTYPNAQVYIERIGFPAAFHAYSAESLHG